MEIKDFLSIVRKYLWIIIISVLVVGALSIFLALRREEIYQAKSQVLVNTENRTVGKHEDLPTLTEFTDIPSDRNVQTQVEILRSSTIFDRAAEMIQLKPAQRKNLTVNVHPVENSDVISIIVKSPHREVARDLANALPVAFLQYSIEMRNDEVEQSAGYIETQINKVFTQLEEAEQKQRNFKSTNNIKDLKSETERKVAELINFESRLEESSVDLEAVKSQIREIQQQLSQSDQERISSKTVQANPVVRKLQEQLASLEVEYARLTQNYNEIHPSVLEVAAQIEEIKNQLKGLEVKTYTSIVTAPNPQYQSLVERLGTLRAEEMALRSKLSGFQGVVSSIDKSLDGLPDEELELIRLIRQQKLLEQLYIALKSKYQDFKVAEETKKSPGRIIEKSKDATSRMQNTRAFMVAIGFMMGLLLGLVVAFTMEYFNDTIETPEQLEATLQISVVGQIPFDDSITDSDKVCSEKPNTPVAESFRALRSRLKHLLNERNANSLLVTSTAVQEGKSFVALNLAITFAQFGKKVILVDGDLRRPTIHKKFNIENKGCTNIFIDQIDPKELIVETSVNNLSVLPSGPLILTENTPVISSEIFESEIMTNLMESLKAKFDIVIVDTPPVMAVTDSLIISSLVEGILFVVSSGDLPKKEISQAKNILESASAPLFGTVLNRTQFSHSYYRYLYYYYDSSSGERRKKKS